jgi:hypothetical protein
MKNASSLPLVCLLWSAFTACNATPPPAALPAPPPSTSPASALSLMERLAAEQAGRSPATRPRAETVQAALAARGLVVERWKQVLASPVGARFCLAGSTELGVGVAVCEYDRPDAARAGRDRSRAVFDRLIPGRQLLVRGTTLLTLTRPDADLADAFTAL